MKASARLLQQINQSFLCTVQFSSFSSSPARVFVLWWWIFYCFPSAVLKPSHKWISIVSIALDYHCIVCQVAECLSKKDFYMKIRELGMKGRSAKIFGKFVLCLRGITPLGKFMEMHPNLLCWTFIYPAISYFKNEQKYAIYLELK